MRRAGSCASGARVSGVGDDHADGRRGRRAQHGMGRGE